MFFELAVLRRLEFDGWEGVSLDSFHGRTSLDGNAHGSSPGVLPPAANKLYERIIAPKGGRASGAFDVMHGGTGKPSFSSIGVRKVRQTEMRPRASMPRSLSVYRRTTSSSFRRSTTDILVAAAQHH